MHGVPDLPGAPQADLVSLYTLVVIVQGANGGGCLVWSPFSFSITMTCVWLLNFSFMSDW